MNKLIAIVLSISLVFGSITPSFAQNKGKLAKQVITGLSGRPTSLANTLKTISALRTTPAGALRANQIYAGVLRAYSLELSQITTIKPLPEIAALVKTPEMPTGSGLEVLRQIFKIDRPLAEKEVLFFETLPELLITREFAIPEAELKIALDFYRKSLIDLAAADLSAIPTEKMAEKWGQAMSAISTLGFYGDATKDANLFLFVHKKLSSYSYGGLTELIVGRSLLALGAEAEFAAFSSYVEKEALSAVTGTEVWDGFATYVTTNQMSVPSLKVEGTSPIQVAEEQKAILSRTDLFKRHLDSSYKATQEWVDLAANKGQALAALPASEVAAISEGGNIFPSLDLSADLNLSDLLSLGSSPIPQGEAVVEETADVLAKAAGNVLVPGALVNETALRSALNLPATGNKAIIKDFNKAMETARFNADKKFMEATKKAAEEGKLLTTADYNRIFGEEFSAIISREARLAPYQAEILSLMQSEQAASAVTAAPAKRELSFDLKIFDNAGNPIPETLELNIRLLDETAVKQFEQLGIGQSETFSLGRKNNSGPFELMITTPGGGVRGIYEPFIEGGKTGIEALHARLLGDFKAGKLSRKVDLNLYSDVFAERATMFAGLTEGLGGLPQATVAPQATALGISDPKQLQAGVSHSQLGNVTSVVFSGLQKVLGIKNTLALGLVTSAIGLGICGTAFTMGDIASTIATLGLGSFVLGMGANGGVKSTNSIFAKELSNDNTTGTARMGFVNARASIGTMTGYLFFPASVLLALTGVEAFQALYYAGMLVPAYAAFNLFKSKVRNVGMETPSLVGQTKLQKVGTILRAAGEGVWGVAKNIANNVMFAIKGGYAERLAQIREKSRIKASHKEYGKLLDEGLTGAASVSSAPAAATPSTLNKIGQFFSQKLPAAFTQYIPRMMLLVGLYHFAGMMFNSGPGAIIGNFIKSAEGQGFVDWMHNLPLMVAAPLTGLVAFGGTKLVQSGYNFLKGKLKKNPVNPGEVEEPSALKQAVKKFLAPTVGVGAAAATALSPEIYSVAQNMFAKLDPTAIAQVATFLTAYVGVWAGRQYLSKFVKSGKLSPQGIIGASGVLSSVAVAAAFIPGLPLIARAALWGVAGLGFANLAGFENSLAMEKYPDQKPGVNMAYTLARLSGALTVLYGSLANTFAANGVPDPQINALILPASALFLATAINGKYFTTNFVQDVKRWMKMPPTVDYKIVRKEVDGFYDKYLKSGGISAEQRAADAERIANKLYAETKHELTHIEEVMAPVQDKIELNTLRLRMVEELKKLLNGATHNNVPLSTGELTYAAFKKYEVQPLKQQITGRVMTKEQIDAYISNAAQLIYGRYYITESGLDEIAVGVTNHNEGLDLFRLDVLSRMYKKELTRVAETRAARYKGNFPSYEVSMKELMDKANKMLGEGHGWEPPAYQP